MSMPAWHLPPCCMVKSACQPIRKGALTKGLSVQIRLNSVYPEVNHIVVVESAMSHQAHQNHCITRRMPLDLRALPTKLYISPWSICRGICPIISTLPLQHDSHITNAVGVLMLLLTLCMVQSLHAPCSRCASIDADLELVAAERGTTGRCSLRGASNIPEKKHR